MPRTLDAPASISMFRLSSRRPPLTVASRNFVSNIFFSQHLSQNRSFSRSLSLWNSGHKDRIHAGDGSPRYEPDAKAHCRPCCAQWSAMRTVQSTSGSPFWDAALTALMGIGFGKPSYIFVFETFVRIHASPLIIGLHVLPHLPTFWSTMRTDLCSSNGVSNGVKYLDGHVVTFQLNLSNLCLLPNDRMDWGISMTLFYTHSAWTPTFRTGY